MQSTHVFIINLKVLFVVFSEILSCVKHGIQSCHKLIVINLMLGVDISPLQTQFSGRTTKHVKGYFRSSKY